MIKLSFIAALLLVFYLFKHTWSLEDTVFKPGYIPKVDIEYFCQEEFNCRLPKNKSGIHTVCEHKCKLGELCVEFQAYEFDNERRQYSLDLHNFYRNVVAAGNESRAGGLPPASNMIAFNYEVQHEPILHCWMRKCKMGHDKCRGIKGDPGVGQNAYAYGVLDTEKDEKLNGFHSLNESVFGWYEEVKVMRRTDIAHHRATEHGPMQIGHATQIIWAITHNIGCGFTVKRESDWAVRMVIYCNYGTGGNVVNRPVYLEGPPASNCPKDLKPDLEYTNLCGTTFAVSKKRHVITQPMGPYVFSHYPKVEEKELKVVPRPPCAETSLSPEGEVVDPYEVEESHGSLSNHPSLLQMSILLISLILFTL